MSVVLAQCDSGDLGMKSARWLLKTALLGSVVVMAAGCSAGAGITTGALFGSGEKPAPPSPSDNNTPTGRALHVGTVSARATKCGYNFDPATLRSKYLAAEAASGMPIADLTKIEQIYDTGYRGVLSAASQDPNYCTKARTTEIKTALNKALAGDYAPPPKKVDQGGGVFGIFDQDVVEDKGPQFGTGDWWDAQRENRK